MLSLGDVQLRRYLEVRHVVLVLGCVVDDWNGQMWTPGRIATLRCTLSPPLFVSPFLFVSSSPLQCLPVPLCLPLSLCLIPSLCLVSPFFFVLTCFTTCDSSHSTDARRLPRERANVRAGSLPLRQMVATRTARRLDVLKKARSSTATKSRSCGATHIACRQDQSMQELPR